MVVISLGTIVILGYGGYRVFVGALDNWRTRRLLQLPRTII